MSGGYPVVYGSHDAPAVDAFAITPNDSADLAVPARALYVGTTGHIAMVTTMGTSVTFSSVPVGVLPVAARRILATGTTASNIVGLR